MSDGKARGQYYANYKAIVHDNDDPQKVGRLRLIIPAVYGKDMVSGWALPACGALSGEGLGQVQIPDKDATVWVFFENGSENSPVWWGAWWGFPAGVSDVPVLAQGGAKGKADPSAKLGPKGTDVMVNAVTETLTEPGPPYDAEYPSNRVLVTKSGIKIEIDDTEGHERVHVWHPTETWQERHPDGTIVERHKNQRWVTIEAGSSGEGNDRLHVYGDQDIVVEGNATMMVKGDYLMHVEGDYSLIVGGDALRVDQAFSSYITVGDKEELVGGDSVRYARKGDYRVGHPIDEVTS